MTGERNGKGEDMVVVVSTGTWIPDGVVARTAKAASGMQDEIDTLRQALRSWQRRQAGRFGRDPRWAEGAPCGVP